MIKCYVIQIPQNEAHHTNFDTGFCRTQIGIGNGLPSSPFPGKVSPSDREYIDDISSWSSTHTTAGYLTPD